MPKTIGNIVVNVTANTQKLQKNLKKSKSDIAQFATVGKAAVLALGVAFTKLASAGIAYNRELENQRDSIKSVIASTSKLVDSQGNILTTQELMNMSGKESIGIMTKLEALNKRTPVDLATTAKMYKAMLPSMKAAGVGQKDLLYITEKLSIAGKNFGLSNEQLLAGLDNIASGSVEANSDFGRMMKTIGLGNDILKKTADKGKLLKESLKGFEIGDTLELQISNSSAAFDKMAGSFDRMLGLSEKYKESLKIMTAVFDAVAQKMESKAESESRYNARIANNQKVIHEGLLKKLKLQKANLVMIAEGEKKQKNNALALASYGKARIAILKNIKQLQEEIGNSTYQPVQTQTGPSTVAKDNPEVAAQLAKTAKDLADATALAVTNAKEFAETYADVPTLAEQLDLDRIKLISLKEMLGTDEFSTALKNIDTQIKNLPNGLSDFGPSVEEFDKIKKAADNLYSTYADKASPFDKLAQDAQTITTNFEMGIGTAEEYAIAMSNINTQMIAIKDSSDVWKTTLAEIKTGVIDGIASSLGGMFRQMMDGTKSFSEHFKSAAKDMLAMIMQMIIKKQLLALIDGPAAGAEKITMASTLAGIQAANNAANLTAMTAQLALAQQIAAVKMASGIGGAFAKGGVFQGGAVTAFAKGGVVDGPTTFPMAANQTGLMGEAGPEAIMPLQRGRDGKLGVTAKSSPVNVTINNNAPATEVQAQQDDNGNIEIIINKIVDDISRGTGPIGSTMESRYGLSKR